MFLLSFVKGVQIRGGESISASGFGPRGPILAGSKSAGTPALMVSFPVRCLKSTSWKVATDQITYLLQSHLQFPHKSELSRNCGSSG